MPTDGSAGPGLVFRSTDDGQSFQAALSPSGVATAHVGLKYFPGLNTLFAYVSKDTGSATSPGTAVYLSTDQGQSWGLQPVFTSMTSVPLPSKQATSWMALTQTTIFWGVDSTTPANTKFTVKGVKKYLFDIVAEKAGQPPAFWGRYIGSKAKGFNLAPDEPSFLLSRNCRILLIYNGTTSGTVGSRQDGVNAADAAMSYIAANGLSVPNGVWIYANTEPSWSPTAEFFQGWSDTMFGSIYGGAGGVYGDTSNEPGAPPHFNTPYCDAFAADPNMRDPSAPAFLYTNQPLKCDGKKTTCDPLAAHAPVFNPDRPPCDAPIVIYQYAIDVSLGTGKLANIVDLDLATGAGFASMWAP